MSVYELVFTRGAQSEYAALDGLARLRVRPDEIGKQLSGPLASCRELKFRADGLRVIYRIRNGQVCIVDILAIGQRDRGKVFTDA